MTSKIKVDNINKVSDDSNIINKCGTTITLGASGDSIALASGASQTGFGRTGTVDWQTSIKTTGFTAVNGEGYFVDTTSGSVTVTLPSSPSAGSIVAIKDYANNSSNNDIVLARNSSNIEGSALDFKINNNGESVVLIYADATKGWLVTGDGNKSAIAVDSDYIIATGGTITTVCTNFKVHTFTSPGSFVVSAAGTPSGSNTVDYLVVAGGGGGGPSNCGAGGGGAGGFRQSSGAASGSYAASPLGSGVAALPVTATSFPISVGAGGATNSGGSQSIFSTIASGGGGTGGGWGNSGGDGGSGGGAGGRNNTGGSSGNVPTVSPPQGNDGGNSAPSSSPPSIDAGGAGGGAGAAGDNAGDNTGKTGAVGVPTAITGSALSYSGGGGSNAESGSHGSASPCGTGGAGGNPAGTNGTTNRGGGGGGNNGSGGSGVVVIRYKFQN